MAKDKLFITLKGGYDSNFTYLLGCPETGEMALIDASVNWDDIAEALDNAINKQGYKKLTKVLLTHVHFDHISSIEEIIENTSAEIYAHPLAADGLLDQKGIELKHTLNEGDIVKVGNQKLAVIHTPGHQEECICFTWGQKIFTGDTLFVNACGRVDLPGSDPEKQFYSLKRIAEKLDPKLQVYAGHDYGPTPTATIAEQRLTNHYLTLFSEPGLSENDQKDIFLGRRMR